MTQTYEEIKEKLAAKKRETLAVQRRIQSFELDLEQIDRSKSELANKKQQQVEVERRVQLEKAIGRATTPLEEERKNIKLLSVQVLDQYKKELQDCNEEIIYNELKSKSDISKEVKEAVTGIREVVVNDVGERFEDEYVRQLKTSKVKIDERSLKLFVNRFHSLNKKVSRFSNSGKGNVAESIGTFIDRISREKLEGNTKGALILFGVMLAAMAMVAWITFPIYVAILTAMVVRNVRKGAVYSRALVDYKIVADNLEEIDTMLRKRAAEEKGVREQKAEEKYRVESSRLEKEELESRNRILRARQDAESSFIFDPSSVERNYNVAINDMEMKRNATVNSLSHSNSEKEILAKEMLQLDEELRQASSEIRLEYLDFSKVGTSFSLDTKFLIDIKDNRPVLFEHSKTTTMFIYDNMPDTTDFIKLISSQLRVRLNPFALRIHLWDKEGMGVNYSSFYKKHPELFKVAANEEQMSGSLEDLMDMLTKRSEIILREYASIVEYNEHMIKLESLTESYQFMFVIKPLAKFLKDDSFGQLMSIGPSVGIYPSIFIDQQDLTKEYIPLIKRCGKIYIMKDGQMFTRAEQFILDQLNQFGN